MTPDKSKLLAKIPEGLRKPLFETYREIASNFSEHRWEPSELNGGKFCECVYWVCHGFLTGTYAGKPTKPPNMVADCRALETRKDTGQPGDRSLRILVPRMLPALYEVRNNRGVGHVGGDVDPNFMDATAVYSTASWILAELVRIFHNLHPDEAQNVADGLVERKTPLIWSAGSIQRVLDTKLSAADQTLLLLHKKLGWIAEKDLVASIEYKRRSDFRTKVLKRLHANRMIEFDQIEEKARISPKGSEHVERKIIAPRLG